MPIIYDMPSEDYHAHQAVSKSQLDRLDVSPAHFKAYLAEGDKDTPAKRFGRIIHMALLEPERAARELVQSPDINKRTKAGQVEWEEFCRLHVGCEIINPEEAETVKRIQESVLSHKTAGALLAYEGHAEASVFWRDPMTGIDCRCRPDKILSGGVIVDAKSARDASPRVFGRAMAEHRYHVQGAMYLDGLCEAGLFADTFLFIAFEKEPPFAVCVHQLQPEDRNLGIEAYRRNLETLARCRREDRWPAYPEDIVQTPLPGWARKEAVIHG